MYNLSKYMRNKSINKNNRKKICYYGVSSNRQIKFMKTNYKDYVVISDIGSCLNMKRKGLLTIIDFAVW